MTISSAEEMQRFAARFARTLTGGEVIALSGDLGAGKTVFVKGLARGLGIEETVSSPTFTLMEAHAGGRLLLCHYDAYRLGSFDEAEAAGLTEYFGRPDCVCAVEWGENLGAEFLRMVTTEIRIGIVGENERELTVHDKQTARGA